MISDLFPYLSDIIFADKKPEEVESQLITTYENLTGRSLARGDPVRLFLEAITLMMIHQRALIDHSAKMNLLAYAKDYYLDHIGALLGVIRLEASHALTTLKFTLSETQDSAIIIPEGTRATPGGGDILFSTVESVEIPAGETEISVTAQCTVTGEIGNGYIEGQIKRLVDPFPYEMTVINTTTSYGGSDVENDENFRERIQLAPESFSTAGSIGAYEFFARSAHSDIIDVAIIGPAESDTVPPGHVYVYPLMTGGVLPTQEILDAVFEICNSEDKRPDTDFLHVVSPEIVSYNLNVKYWIDRKRATQATQIQLAVSNAVQDWITWQKTKLGRDINPSELNHRMITAGAKRTEIISPDFQILELWQVAVENEVNVILGGLEDG